MNIVDFTIIVLLLFAIARGIRAGMLFLLLSSVGFVGGLLLGSWVAKRAALHVTNTSDKLLIILLIELLFALVLSAIGEVSARHLNKYVTKLHLGRLNQVFGAALEVVFALIVVWLIASGLTNVKSLKIGYDIHHSSIISALDGVLPNPPDLFAQLSKVINPNGFPSVFVGLEPQHTTISPANRANNQAIIADEQSIVKVQGYGCGGIVDGSGFVVAKGIVVTNAHVVAGIVYPKVINSDGTYSAEAVWFDPNLDIAVLKVPGLPNAALTLKSQVLPDGDAAAVLGYPGGGPLVVGNAAVIDEIDAVGRNIYGQGTVSRNIYEVQAGVEPGNSGGPLVGPDGSVAGVVFAKSVSQNNLGYAILINQVIPIIRNAQQQNTLVSTGQCAK